MGLGFSFFLLFNKKYVMRHFSRSLSSGSHTLKVGVSGNSREKTSLNTVGKKEQPGNYSINLALFISGFSSLIYCVFGQVPLGQLL